VGLVYDIQENLHYSLANKKIIILGAGGAARGILQPLKDQQPADIFIVNRTLDRAKKIAEEFCVNYLDSLENMSADVVIDCLPFNADIMLPSTFLFSDNSLFYDLKYQREILKNNAMLQSNGK